MLAWMAAVTVEVEQVVGNIDGRRAQAECDTRDPHGQHEACVGQDVCGRVDGTDFGKKFGGHAVRDQQAFAGVAALALTTIA